MLTKNTFLLAFFAFFSFSLFIFSGCPTPTSGEASYPQLQISQPDALCYIRAAGDTQCIEIRNRLAALDQTESPVSFTGASNLLPENFALSCLFSNSTEYRSTTFSHSADSWQQSSSGAVFELSTADVLLFYIDPEDRLRSRDFLSSRVSITGDTFYITAAADPDCIDFEPYPFAVETGIMTVILDDNASDWLEFARELAWNNEGLLAQPNLDLNDIPVASPSGILQDLEGKEWEIVWQGSAETPVTYSEGMLYLNLPNGPELVQFHDAPIRLLRNNGALLIETTSEFTGQIRIEGRPQ